MRDAHDPEHAAGPGGDAVAPDGGGSRDGSRDGGPDRPYEGRHRADPDDPEGSPEGIDAVDGGRPGRSRTPSPADAVDLDPEDDPADVLGDLAGFGDVRGITDLSGLLDVAGPDVLDQIAHELEADDEALAALDALEELDQADQAGRDEDDEDDRDDAGRPATSAGPIFGGERGTPGAAGATATFRRLATRIADAVLALSPETAPAGTRAARTGRLADLTEEGTAHAQEVLSDALTALDAVDDTVLPVADAVDLEILRVWVAGLAWDLTDAAGRDPLRHVPSRILPSPWEAEGLPPGSPLDTGALDTVAGLLRTAHGRLDDLPGRLADARHRLRDLSAPGVDATLTRVRRLQGSLPADVAALTAPVDDPESLAPGLRGALGAAMTALEEHARWLASVRPSADCDPRIGAQRYGARLWYLLDVELDPEALLVRAESDLLAVEEELAELAGLLGAASGPAGVRDLLRSVADGASHDPRAALAEVAREVAALDLVSVPAGVAGDLADVRCALAAPPGRPDERSLPDTPAPGAVGGALREVVAAHCGVPGHALQAAHAAHAELPTATRLVAPSPLFTEGWAVTAESLLTLSDAGTPAQRARRRVAHLALQLRRAVRCVVDVRCHVHGLDADAATALLADRAHLFEGDAARAVASTLVHPVAGSVGYVGGHLVADVVSRLGAVRPDAGGRAVHDAVLAHGPVPPRHLAVLLGLPAEQAGRH